MTTLFCDLVGFTRLSERHDPELVDAMLRRYYAAARRVIESYGGTVEKYIGDAVVAVFGVPTLHEDDPERAVRAGLRLVDEIDALPGIGGERIEARVGVNTGDVLVRLDVDPASGQGFLTGDAVNVAARLQSVAPPMTVAVGKATHAATNQVFSFDACHPVSLKGKSQPLEAWLATAPLVRTGAELRSFTTSFVGRKPELGELLDLLDEVSAQRSPRCALIVGEPGIGKSRLLAEFAHRLDARSTTVTWRQGRCLPFGSNVTFWALSEIVRDSAGILESDGVARAEARLETVLPEGEERERMRARLRPLLGLEAEDASREENFTVWREFLESLAQDGPTVIVVEDLHWADEAMLAFMDYLASSAAEVPLLVLATARPEVLELTGAGAGYVAAAQRLPLGPLSGDETAQLLLVRLNATSLPVSLQAKLLERSGGNPLFAEELVRLLQDRGLLETRAGQTALKEGVELPTPDSIGALIAARLDLLSPDRKALLADAAVVGRTFWVGAVATVGSLDRAEVFEGLHELIAKELVRPERGSSMEGEAEFSFVHALVCDVAYAQLTKADRAVKHAALAQWLEERTGGRTEDLAEVLAFHYGTALEMATSCGLDLEDELLEPTERYLALAGGRAAPLDASAAAAHFARAERVNEEASRPKRWLLSRRRRRTLRRRAPLLAAVVALIIVVAIGALAFWMLVPSKTTGAADMSDMPKTMTPAEIADQYGQSVVSITTDVPILNGDRVRWNSFSESGVIVSADGLIFTSGAPLMPFVIPYQEGGAIGSLPAPVWKRPSSWRAVYATVEYFGEQGQYHRVKGVFLPAGISDGAGVVKIDTGTARLPAIPLADSEAVSKGDSVVAMYRDGTLLARAPGSLTETDYSDVGSHGQQMLTAMRTSAALPNAAIGGALVDKQGHLVGVMGHKLSNGGQPKPPYDDASSAVSVGVLKWAVSQAQAYVRQLPLAYLGVQHTTLTRDFPSEINPAGPSGALVEFVVPGSPAGQAGIRGGTTVGIIRGAPHMLGGDVIIAIDGVAIRSEADVPKVLGRLDPDSTVPVRLVRNGRSITVRVKLAVSPLKT